MSYSIDIPLDTDYSKSWEFDSEDTPCVIKTLLVDSINPKKPGIWIISNDGQKIKIPFEFRKLVAKLMREATER